MSTPNSLLARPKLLLVDDDGCLRSSFASALRAAGYRVLEAAEGQAGLELFRRQKPELVILDVDMPQLDGWQTLEQLRAGGNRTPVLMLTGLGDVVHRVRGLGAGADDYLAKPCDMRELLARIHALLRRSQPAANRTRVLRFGDHTVDLERHVVRSVQVAPALTRTEFALLEMLALKEGRPASRDELLDGVWGYTHRPATRTVETHIWRLRGKLGDTGDESRWIRTVPGAGYSLHPDQVPERLQAAG
jgi:two-component system response regulator MprA